MEHPGFEKASGALLVVKTFEDEPELFLEPISQTQVWIGIQRDLELLTLLIRKGLSIAYQKPAAALECGFGLFVGVTLNLASGLG